MPDLSDFRRKPSHPKGWEPSLDWDGTSGTITTGPMENEPDQSVWDTLIADWGLDPLKTQVVDGTLQIRAWDSFSNGQPVKMKYYRCSIAPRTCQVDRPDIEKLCSLIEKRKPVKPVTTKGNASYLVLLSDFQVGKGGEPNGGSPETIERILKAIDASLARFKQLRKTHEFEAIYLIGLGDLVESCSGHYAQQTFNADLSDREQDRAVRRLILYAIDAFVGFGLPIVAVGVPGNHGENRMNGKSFTNFLDNRDYAAFETVAEICAANPERYGHVSFPLQAINEDELTIVLSLSGVPVGFAHGHQFRSGTNSQAKMETWLKGQALGRTGIADAQILCAGHLHHFTMSEATGRTMLQVPALDGGSRWFTATSGNNSPAGMVTLVVGEDVSPRGWTDLLIV